MDFEKKVCFVTGGGSGIGRAVALELAKRGAYVAVGGRTLKKVEQVAAEMGERGLAIQMDVSSLSDWQEAVKQIHQRSATSALSSTMPGLPTRRRWSTLQRRPSAPPWIST